MNSTFHNITGYIFCRKPKVEELWISDAQADNPFDSQEFYIKTILEVKNGFVRWRYKNHNYGADSSSLSEFMYFNQPYEE